MKSYTLHGLKSCRDTLCKDASIGAAAICGRASALGAVCCGASMLAKQATTDAALLLAVSACVLLHTDTLQLDRV